jgi:hypothetical protein
MPYFENASRFRGHTLLPHSVLVLLVLSLSGRQRLTVLIGITPPRQRPGRTLGLNLDCAQVSLSLRMRYRLKCNQHFLLHRYSSLTPCLQPVH